MSRLRDLGLAALGMVLTPALAGCQAGESRFRETRLPVGESPSSVATSDLDADGDADLLVGSGGSLLVFLNDGAGRLEPGPLVAADVQPAEVALADFDGDGALDAAAAVHETRELTLLLGDGRGGLRPAPGSPLPLAISPHAHAVGAADLDGDGRVDLVVDDRDREAVAVLRGRGDATFESGRTVLVGGDPYRGFAIADLDGDGRPDLATPNPGSVGVTLAGPEGGFRAPRAIDVGFAPFAVAAGDFDGDGTPDLCAAAGEGRSEVVILLGTGAGEFRPLRAEPFAAGRGGSKLVFEDLDGDGRDDCVVTGWEEPRAHAVLGGETAPRVESWEVGENPWGAAIADLDGDGLPDLAVVNEGSDDVSVLLSGGASR